MRSALRIPRRLGKPKRSLGWVDKTGANMTVAFNTGADTYYAARRFANVVYDADAWAAVTSAGLARTGTAFVPSNTYTGSANTWSQFQGTLFGDGDGSGTDGKYFRAAIASTAYGMPAGVYTVFNPSGQEFAIGVFSGPTTVNWTTAKYVTFTYTPSSAGMMLWCRRSLANTGAGNLQIILPGCVGNGTVDTVNGTYQLNGTSGITSGNPWNPDFLTFHQSLGTHHVRWMAAMSTNTGVEQDWVDRILPTSITFTSQYLTGHAVPHELAIDFANRTGMDPWDNCPALANSDYISKWAALYAATLDPNRRVGPEYINETFNYFGAFGTGTNWVAYGQFTKHTATLSDATSPGAPVFYQPSHGRSVGDTIVLFPTRENAWLASASANAGNTSPNATGVPTYYMASGYSYTISVVPDANHFTLNLAALSRTVPAGLVNILYAWTAEPGCTAASPQPDINHANLQAAVWDAFDAALGPARVVHLMGSQAADSSHTAHRLGTSSAIATRTEHVHVAPYYSGMYWAATLTGTGGQITPRLWSSVAGTAWWGLYASGSTPTALDIVKQQGTGFIGGGGTTGTACAANPAGVGVIGPTLPAVAGLTDGTNYAAFILFQETATGNFWRIGTGTDAQNPTNVVSTSGSPVYLYDTYANQAARARMHTLSVANFDVHAAAITAAGSTATLVCYEGGPDMALAADLTVQHWISSYFTDTTAVAAMKNYYNHLARVGYRSLTHFLDIQGGGQYAPVGGAGFYDFVNNQLFSNVADPRYAMLSAFSGLVPKQSAISSGVSAARTATAITAAPGGFPATVYSSLPGGFTCTIVDGDWTNNFAVSGSNLVMVNAAGIDFSKYAPRTLTIEAADAYSSVFFTLTIPLGTAWYPADAQFVWDSVGASAGTAMHTPTNPPFANFGSDLAEVTGSGNPVITSSSGTVSNDLWKMAGYVFANANAMTQTCQTNIAFMVLHVVDVGDQTVDFQYEFGVGSGSQSISLGIGSSNTVSRWRLNTNSVSIFAGLQDAASNPAKGTKVVHWLYVDPVAGTAVAGQNQTAYSAGALSGLAVGNFALGRDVRIGSANGSATAQSQQYHGSAVVLFRAGLTESDVLAIVQAAQTRHGI